MSLKSSGSTLPVSPDIDARRLPLRHHRDARGCLLPLDFGALPFTPARAFVVHDAPAGAARGRHAHRHGMQLLVCVHGRVQVDLRQHAARASVVLDPASDALLVPAGVWAQQTYLDPGSVLLVLSSEPYDRSAYIDVDPGDSTRP